MSRIYLITYLCITEAGIEETLMRIRPLLSLWHVSPLSQFLNFFRVSFFLCYLVQFLVRLYQVSAVFSCYPPPTPVYIIPNEDWQRVAPLTPGQQAPILYLSNKTRSLLTGLLIHFFFFLSNSSNRIITQSSKRTHSIIFQIFVGTLKTPVRPWRSQES